MNYVIGLDLGTHYTRIWKPEEGIVLRCPTAAAIDSRTHHVVALGSEACRMIGKTPEHILAYRPVTDGLITDFEVASRMVTGFFDAKRLCTLFRRPAVIVAAPYYLDQVHQLAVENAVENALYLYYASPNLAVQNSEYYIEEMGENYDLLYSYPEAYTNEDGTLNDSIAQYYKDLSQVELLDENGKKMGITALEYMTELWIYLKLE